MGCDIHIQLEQRVGGRWYPRDSHLDDSRDYESFELLAGVRGVKHQPIAEPRGLPDDSPWVESHRVDAAWLGEHSFSWLLGSEVLANKDRRGELYLFDKLVSEIGWIVMDGDVDPSDLRIVFGFDS